MVAKVFRCQENLETPRLFNYPPSTNEQIHPQFVLLIDSGCNLVNLNLKFASHVPHHVVYSSEKNSGLNYFSAFCRPILFLSVLGR